MNARQLKALRKRQAQEAVIKAREWIARYESKAAVAEQADLLNEAIHYANMADRWRQRLAIIAEPSFHAIRAGEQRRRREIAAHETRRLETSR